jgi:hypothetical protein
MPQPKRYLMKWICDHGHQNWAYEFKCQHSGCSDPRSSGVKWFLPDPLVEANDTQWKLKGPGPNWFCRYCDCENPVYEDENCGKCGAPIGNAMTTKKRVYPSLSDMPRTASEATAFETEEIERGDLGWHTGPSEEDTPKPKPKRNDQSTSSSHYTSPTASFTSNPNTFLNQEIGNSQFTFKNLALMGIVATVIITIVFAIYFIFFDTETKNGWVSSLEWVQYSLVEQYQELTKTDWDENVPDDAYNEECTYTIRERDKKVIDGYETVKVPGKCKQSVPVECPPVSDGAGGVTQGTNCTENVEVDCMVDEKREISHTEDVWDNSCSYNVMEWVEIEKIPASGVISVLPPSGNSHETFFDHKGYVDIPNQIRITDQLGTYTVNFSSEYTEPFSYDYDYNEWLQFDLRENVSIEVNSRGKVPFRPKIEILR